MTQVLEETNAPSTGPSAIAEHVCSLQLHYLVQQLSALAGWIVYKGTDAHDSDRLRSVCCLSPDHDALESLALSDLPWLDTAMPILPTNVAVPRSGLAADCSQIPLSSSVFVGSVSQLLMAEGSMVSIYWFDSSSAESELTRWQSLSKGESRSEYLLLWTKNAPTVDELKLIEQQGAKLQAYLNHERRQAQHQTQMQASVQVLEKAFQRIEHQIRNPLALIGLYANTLDHQLPTGECKSQATMIKTTVEQLQTQLKGLLSCSRGRQLRCERHDLQNILAESILAFQGLWIEQQIHVEVPDSSLYLVLDRIQIRQVFDNLLHNALCFSPPKSQVIWQWQIFQQEVLITVSDQGPGIEETKLTQIFDPYCTDRPGGTGLGLAIAKKVVLDHGGQIWVENLPDQGCQFSVSLPRIPPIADVSV